MRQERTLCPGLVDLQINGHHGVDFSAPDLTEEAAREVCRAILAGGTAAFLPTVISADLMTYRRNLPILARIVASEEFAGRVPGLHLEGPFIAPDRRVTGAHRIGHVRQPDPDLLHDLQDWAGGTIRLLTLAPEMDGAQELIGAAVRLGITVSVGHSFADSDDLAMACAAGARALTHFGNAVPQDLPRHDNPLIAGLLDHGLSAMLVVDGHHLSRDFTQLAFQRFRTDKLILVSDASSLAGAPPGLFEMFGQEIEVDRNGRIWNAKEQHLHGSGAALIDCVNQALAWELIGAEEAVTLARTNPLALIGMSESAVDSTPRIAFDQAARRFAVLDA